jgi:hypothetical protein
MEKILWILTFIFLSNSPSLAQKQVLLDFRDDSSLSIKERPKLAAKTEKSVISKVVISKDKPCDGNLNPQVIDYLPGKFTTSKAPQTVYLVDLGDSCHPRNQGTRRLAVFSGNNLVSYTDATGYSQILKSSDINSDGQEELVLQGSFLGQGYFVVFAQLVEMNHQRIQTVKDFKVLYKNNLATGASNLSRQAAVISVSKTDTGRLVFTRDNYSAQCVRVDDETIEGECSVYKYINSGDFPEDAQ